MASKPKGPSTRQLKAEELQLQLLQQQLAASEKPLEMPMISAPPPAPPPPPPPSATSADAIQAGQDQRRQASQRTNVGRKTLFAGETGGGGNYGGGGMKTLLG